MLTLWDISLEVKIAIPLASGLFYIHQYLESYFYLGCFARLSSMYDQTWIGMPFQECICDLCAAPYCDFFQKRAAVHKIAQTLISYATAERHIQILKRLRTMLTQRQSHRI
mmetsp:Transcript_21343/g.27585  ORF Transcript_21343/g.27585 Transcript_21343/m.27585 type:complete len:111 (+) Transcript_21343:147-479(+)